MPTINDVRIQEYTGKLLYADGSSTSSSSSQAAPMVLPTPALVPNQIYGSLIGNLTDGEVLFRIIYVQWVSFQSNFFGSLAICVNQPASEVIFAISVNSNQVGTLTFPAWSNVGVFASQSPIYLSPGDILEMDAPVPMDPSFFGISYTFLGQYMQPPPL